MGTRLRGLTVVALYIVGILLRAWSLLTGLSNHTPGDFRLAVVAFGGALPTHRLAYDPENFGRKWTPPQTEVTWRYRASHEMHVSWRLERSWHDHDSCAGLVLFTWQTGIWEDENGKYYYSGFERPVYLGSAFRWAH
jgi:hypothetical protein